MEKLNTISNKRYYHSPLVERILLDNEISLVLDSNNDLPPAFESVNSIIKSEHFNNNPFSNNPV